MAQKEKSMIKVKQTGSSIRRPKDQLATLKGLGLNKMNRVRELQDTPEVRGMIRKVRHMVEIVD
jgi:large subunit ribosomal protein L30